MKAYVASPAAFGDDTNIPESGNGVPDILDEVRWGMSWLERMQNDDGSVLSIVGLASASPPSAATGQSLYGPANTSATLASAAAYAYGAIVFKASANPAWRVYGAALQRRAERAYAWAENHPQVIFKNSDAATGSLGLGAGQQETDEHGRRMLRLTSACYLFELTGKVEFKAYFEQNFADVGIVASRYLNPFDEDQQEMLRHCAALPGIAAAVRQTTQQSFSAAFAAASWRQPRALGDAYMAELSQYTWGSNAIKAAQGLLVLGSLPSSDKVPAGSLRDVALGYLHYLHGVNPLSLVYLSNMGDFGATSSVRSFFHSWFTADSPRWSRVGASTYGPPPGFLTGGPNPGYKPDGCCPSHCRGQPKGVSCAVTALTPPLGQPPAKSYLDFNQGWPVNSWEVTENSNSYQVRYIRLLSRFVR